MSSDYVSVKDVMMEKELYRALTQVKYRRADSEVTISSLINDMLREYLHTYILSKNMGHLLVSKDVLRTAVDALTDEQINEVSAANATRYKEGAIIEHGKPSLAAYLAMIRAFAKANKFDMEISKNPENENQVLIMSFHMGEKFSMLKGNTYRILLDEFVDIERIEITGNTLYFEFKPKQELIQESQS